MFHLEVKDKQYKFTTLLGLIYRYVILIPISLVVLIGNLLNIDSQYSHVVEILNMCCIVILAFLSTLMYIINFSLSLHWRKETICEFRKIIRETKLPKELPKVVYVYTTKNDFMESRILQNMQQTYKNVEYWISVGGGEKDKNINKIKSFAKKHKINLYIMEEESTSKADNLNSFLKHYKKKFDYLLIGDADCAFDKEFVINAIKMFYSNRAISLGYVSSAIMNYRGNNCFTNSIMHFENEKFLIKELSSNYLSNLSQNLYSACCLISNKMLKEMDNKFPESNLEDWYMEKYANKNMWQGLILPINVTMQAFDKDIFSNLNRISRLYTWGIKYTKEQAFSNYRAKFFKSNNRDFLNLFLGVFFIVGFIMGTLLIYYAVITILNQSIDLWNNVYLWTYLLSLVINILLIVGIKAFYLRKLNKEDGFKKMLLFGNYGIVLITNLFKDWFLSLFFSKYKSFTKKEKWHYKKIILTLTIILISSIFLIVIANILMFWNNNLLNNMNRKGFIYLVVFINCFLGYIFMYSFSFLSLIVAGKIKSNEQYDENKFVYCDNEFILQKDIQCLN